MTVVGTGIRAGSHLTPEARWALEHADEVFYLVADPVAEAWLERLRPDARSLQRHYEVGRRRRDVYEAIAGELVAAVAGGKDVCAAFYGHPGVFVRPSHEAVDRVRRDGFPARMLPAVSAVDCLFADLGVDPGRMGLQSYEATDFLIHGRRVDPSAALVLWQVSVVGDLAVSEADETRGLAVLGERLQTLYPAHHEVTLYEASPYPICSPLVEKLTVSDLAAAEPTAMATLFVPPAERRRRDQAMLDRLGIP